MNMENTSEFITNLTTPSGIDAVFSGNARGGLTINQLCNCYVLPVVCGIGILGNIANLITLASPKLRAVSYMYLRALGAADLLCMMFVLVFAFFEILKLIGADRIYNDYVSAWYRAHLMLPLINASVSAGILLVVALTVERYISICWPIYFRQWNLTQRAVPLIASAYALPFVLYIPMYWQHEATPMNQNLSHIFNNTVAEIDLVTFYTVNDNKLLQLSGVYKAYKWSRETLLKFVPIVTLAVLNFRIISAFGKMRDRRKRLSTSGQCSGNENGGTKSFTANAYQQQQQNHYSHFLHEQRNLLFLLIAIAIMFFVCNTPAAINLLFISEENKKLPAYMLFRATANFMEILNHALNFYVFCLCSRDYRTTFYSTFPCVKKVTDGTAVVKRRFSESVTKIQSNVLEGGRVISGRRQSNATVANTGNLTALSGLCADFASRMNLMKNSVFLYPINEDFETEFDDAESDVDAATAINGGNGAFSRYLKLATSDGVMEGVFVDANEDNANFVDSKKPTRI